MNKKKTLFILISIVFLLLFWFIQKYYVYPVYVNLPKMSLLKKDWVLTNLVNHHTTSKEILFWDTPINFGITKYDLKKLNLPQNHIVYDGRVISANIIYQYSSDYYGGKLEGINLRIPYSSFIEDKVTSYYGRKHIHSYKGRNYYKIWLLDDGFVVLEKKTNLNGKGYLYIKIGYGGIGWIQEVQHGAYINTFDEKQDGAYIKKEANLSFQGIRLGASKEQILDELQNNSNIKGYHQIDSIKYSANTNFYIPQENTILNLDLTLLFYKDILVNINIYSKNPLARHLGSLYKDKYIVNNAEKHWIYGKWRNYTRTNCETLEWEYRNQKIGLQIYYNEHSTKGSEFSDISIHYIQKELYEEYCEQLAIQRYLNNLKEERNKQYKKEQDSILMVNKTNKAKESI